MSKIAFTCFLFLLVLLAAPALEGQAVVGTLSGRVTTAEGTGVPNAAVTITNQQTNVSQRVLTGPDGAFNVAGLAPGTYRLEVESAGFKRTAVSAIELTAGAPGTINVTIEAGPATETVELMASAAMVQTDNGVQSINLTTRAVRSYPILDRNYQELNGLAPGVTPPLALFPAATDPAQQRFYSVTGQNPLLNRHYLDGMINHEPFRGSAIRVAPAETIREMSLRTAALPAEQGFTAAGWTNVLSQAGTNDWHGSAFWFNSLDEYNTRKWFSPFSDDADIFGDDDADPANLVYNQFGGSVGGPIRRDRTFFFGSYEGTYNRDHRTTFATVPTLDMRAGNFSGISGLTLFNPNTGTAEGTGRSQFTGNVIPSGQINPFSSAIANALPAPNLPGFFNNLAGISYLRRDGNRFDGRLDHRFTDNTAFFVRYGYSNWGVVDESPLGETFGGGTTTRLVAQNAIASFTHNMSPNLLGELRLGYNRYKEGITPRAFGASSILGVPSNQLPALQFAGGTTLSPYVDIGSDRAVDNTYNLMNDWIMTSGRHQIRFGADIRNLRSTGFNPLEFGPRGTAIFGPGPTSSASAALGGNAFASSFASFLLGAPTQIGTAAFPVTPGVEQWKFAGYVADRINLQIGGLRGATLDLGLRYDVFAPLKARSDGSWALYNPLNNTFDFAGVGGIDRSFQDWDINNFSPRIGIAVSPGGRTVIRAGYSLNYFQVPYRFSGIQPALVGSILGTAGSFGPADADFGPNAFQPPSALQIENGVSAGNLPAIFRTAKDITPYVHTYNFQIQHELPASMLFQVGYVGSLGRQLPFLNELNLAAPGSGVSGQPFFEQFERTASTLRYDYGLTNNYNALQTSLSKRLSHGVNFQASYTWSKAQDYASDFGRLLNPFNRELNYGPADYDRQHVLSIAHLFEIPTGDRFNGGVLGQILGGWQLNGVFRWATGTPFNVLADPLGCNCPGVGAVTANVVGDPDIANNPGPDRRLFNPSFFSQPSGSAGNLGRNAIRGPGFKNYDLSLFKSFGIRDKGRLEVRGAAYNISNSPRFDNPVNFLNSPAFGEVYQNLPGVDGLNAMGGRVITLGARFLF